MSQFDGTTIRGQVNNNNIWRNTIWRHNNRFTFDGSVYFDNALVRKLSFMFFFIKHLGMRKLSARWVPRLLTVKGKNCVIFRIHCARALVFQNFHDAAFPLRGTTYFKASNREMLHNLARAQQHEHTWTISLPKKSWHNVSHRPCSCLCDVCVCLISPQETFSRNRQRRRGRMRSAPRRNRHK